MVNYIARGNLTLRVFSIVSYTGSQLIINFFSFEYSPLPLVEGGSRLLSSLGRGEPPLAGATVLRSLPSSSGCKSDITWCVHNASSTMCGENLLPQPFCS